MPKKKYTEEFIAQLKNKYDEGLSSLEVDSFFNLPQGTTRNLFRRKGISCRKPLKHQVDWNLIYQLKAEGKTNQEIAQRLDIKLLTLKDWGLSSIPNPLYKKYGLKHHIKNINFFRKITTPLQAYILGWITADGSISSKNALSIELVDKDIVSLIREVLCPSVKLKTYKSRTTVCFNCKCKQWKLDLATYNVVPNKTSKEIPMPILDKSLMSYYIQGVFEGNGCITKSSSISPNVTITFGSHRFLQDLGNYLNQEGIVTKKLTPKRKQSNCSVITFASRKDTQLFFEYIYSNTVYKLQRKFNLAQHYCHLTP